MQVLILNGLGLRQNYASDGVSGAASYLFACESDRNCSRLVMRWQEKHKGCLCHQTKTPARMLALRVNGGITQGI